MVPEEPTYSTPRSARHSRRPALLTRKERRRRIWLLSFLLLLLALLAYTTYYYAQNRRMPLVGVANPQVVEPPTYLYSITGAGENRMRYPLGVAVSDTDRVYVVDYGRNRMSIYTTAGTFIRAFNSIGDGKKLLGPVCVTVRGQEVWVTDRQLGTIEIFDLDGKHLRTFKPKGEKLPMAPLALAFDNQGRFVVTDVLLADEHRILFFSAEGSRTATVGRTYQANKLEDSPGGFWFPNAVAMSSDGSVFVADGNNRRVQVFTADGTFKSFVDTSGIPRGLVVDNKNRLLVVDALAHVVDVYSTDGTRLTQFGTRGFGPGQFNYPNYIDLDRRGRIYISDRGNDQIQVWGWPKAEPPAVVVPKSPLGWAAYIIPPLLLLPLLLLRKKRVVVTPDFVDMLVATEEIAAVAKKKRLHLVAPQRDAEKYAGRVEEGVDLSTLIKLEGYSETDARALAERYGFTETESIYLSMAERAKALATQDVELRRLAVLADIRALDVEEFLKMFIRSEV